MKRLLLALTLAAIFSGCFGECRHKWSKVWESYSANPGYDANVELRIALQHRLPEYVRTSGDLPVAHETRTCSKCGFVKKRRPEQIGESEK